MPTYNVVSLVGETPNGRLAIRDIVVEVSGDEAAMRAWAEHQASGTNGWVLPCGTPTDVHPERISTLSVRPFL